MLWEKAKKFLFWLAERGLAITLLLALAVKIYLLFLRDYAIVNDGMLYVEIIRRVFAAFVSRVCAALSPTLTPLIPSRFLPL